MTEYQLIYNNVNSSVIEDIQFVYQNTTCKYQYGEDYSPLFQYEWPGTQMSCDCSKSVVNEEADVQKLFDQYFTVGKSCTKTNLNKNCSTVYELSPQNLTGWNDNQFSEPFILCGKRTPNVNLRTNYTLCQQRDVTVCGDGDFTFCVPNNTKCPITKLGFTRNETLYSNNEYATMFNTGSGLYFYFLRNTNSSPIVQFKVSEGDWVCRNNSNNISPNRSDYPLMRVQRQNCQLFDEYYSKIAYLDEEQFYFANRVKYFTQLLPEFKIEPNYNWTLFSKTYIPLNPSCSANTIEEFITNINYLSTFDELFQRLLNVSIIFFIMIGLLYNFGQIVTINNYIWPFQLRCLKIRKRCKYFWFTINLLLSFLFLIYTGIVFYITRINSNYFQDVIFCFNDSISTTLLLTINDALNRVEFYLMLSLIFLVLQAVLAIFIIVYECKLDSEDKNQEPIKSLPDETKQNCECFRLDANNSLKEIDALKAKRKEIINQL